MSRTPEQCLDEAERYLTVVTDDDRVEVGMARAALAEAWVRLGLARLHFVEPAPVMPDWVIDPGTWHAGTHDRPIEDQVGPAPAVPMPTNPAGWEPEPEGDDVKQAADKAIGRAQLRARRVSSTTRYVTREEKGIQTHTSPHGPPDAVMPINRTALAEAYEAGRRGQL